MDNEKTPKGLSILKACTTKSIPTVEISSVSVVPGIRSCEIRRYLDWEERGEEMFLNGLVEKSTKEDQETKFRV
jgi:hypothetical protein